MSVRRFSLLLAAAAVLAIGVAPLQMSARAAERAVPVVVELFTSQGCNSCPPADTYLGELAKRPGVLALSLHVDYWDYIGWKDPFAQHAFTLRQREYSHALAQRYVYTPQMVINGRAQGVGSERAEIEKLISAAAKPASPETRPTIRIEGDSVRIAGGQEEAGRLPAAVWLVLFDAEHWTPVARGENAGQKLGEYNVVREWRQLGLYDGKPAAFKTGLDPATSGRSGCAVLLQSRAPKTAEGDSTLGPILAAAVIDPSPK
jgi:hypothetical protein